MSCYFFPPFGIVLSLCARSNMHWKNLRKLWTLWTKRSTSTPRTHYANSIEPRCYLQMRSTRSVLEIPDAGNGDTLGAECSQVTLGSTRACRKSLGHGKHLCHPHHGGVLNVLIVIKSGANRCCFLNFFSVDPLLWVYTKLLKTLSQVPHIQLQQ